MERIQRGNEMSLARVASPVPPLEGVIPGTESNPVRFDAALTPDNRDRKRGGKDKEKAHGGGLTEGDEGKYTRRFG
jgi:hypothetical protein